MLAMQYTEYGDPEVIAAVDVPQPHAGPGQVRIAVRASGVTPVETALRAGRMVDVAPISLPHIPGTDAAGVVDEVGPDVTGTAVGDRVFGLTPIARIGGAAAEFAVLDAWAPVPGRWSWEAAGGAAGNVETATRVLDTLAVGPGTVLVVDGAAGGVGSIVVPLALVRGAVVIGTARASHHAFLTGLGAVPTTYGPGLGKRLAALGVPPVTAALDLAGAGGLAELVAVAGSPDRVVTIADLDAARHGVHLSRTGGPGGEPQHLDGLAVAARLGADGRLDVPLHAVVPFDAYPVAHVLSAAGGVRGKIVVSGPFR